MWIHTVQWFMLISIMPGYVLSNLIFLFAVLAMNTPIMTSSLLDICYPIRFLCWYSGEN